jgi:hypothetical protein
MDAYEGPKVFCCGLPRTGTKAIAAVAHMAGLRIAHSNMTGIKLFNEADFFADVPVWSDFQTIESSHPGSRWVYTTRHVESRFTSFKEMLGRYYLDLMWHMDIAVGALSGEVNKDRVREYVSYKRIFGKHASVDRDVWYFTYRAHEEAVGRFFDTLDDTRKIIVDVSKQEDFHRFVEWLGFPLVRFPKVR